MFSSADIVRWACVGGIVGGVLLASFNVLHPAGETIDDIQSSQWALIHATGAAGALLSAVGVAAVVLGRLRELGGIAVGGLVALVTGLLLVAGDLYVSALLRPALADRFPDAETSLFDDATIPGLPFLSTSLVLLLAIGTIAIGVRLMAQPDRLDEVAGGLFAVGGPLYALGERFPRPLNVVVELLLCAAIILACSASMRTPRTSWLLTDDAPTA